MFLNILYYAEVCLSVCKFYQSQPRSALIFTQSAGRKEEADLIKRISPIARQKFEFYRQQSVLNIDEMISLLEQKIVWQQLKVTEEVLLKNFCFTFSGG